MKRLVLIALLTSPTPLLAQTVVDLELLDREVAQFTGASIGQSGGAAQPIDRRLHLVACKAPPMLSWYGSRQDTVLVQCPDPASWRVFVPLVAARGAPSEIAVQRGEAVTIAVSGEGFSVAQAGEAMDSGPVGAWIRVRTAAGNTQPIRAKVIRPGLVRLDIDSDTGI